MKPRDIYLFNIGDIVDIPGVENLTGIKIVNINEAGVAVSSPNIGPYYVISGKSPAIYHIPKPNDEIAPIGKPESFEAKNIRKSVQNKIKDIKNPGEIFTIKQIAEFNNVPTLYATNWVKENCIEAGKAEKKEGQRGKTATLYKLKL